MTTADTPGNDEWRRKVNRWAIAIVIGLVVVVAFVGCIAGSIQAGGAKHYDIESIEQCEARVKKELKAPSTANFDSTTTGSGDTWTVTGTVDSENGFGATVQSEYQCTVVMNDDTATTVIDRLDE